MLKNEFINELRARLSGLPEREVADRLCFYGEMIDDRIEEGLCEEAAVAAVGSIDEIVAEITADIPLSSIIKERTKKTRRLSAFEITLIILGFPLWFPLLIAAFSVVISLYAVLWSLVVSLWSVFVALVGAAFGVVVGGIITLIIGNAFSALAFIGVGALSAGLSIFLFFGCRAATKGSVRLTKALPLAIKKCFIKREGAQ